MLKKCFKSRRDKYCPEARRKRRERKQKMRNYMYYVELTFIMFLCVVYWD